MFAEDNREDFLKIIFYYYLFNDKFIINLLLHYKNRKSLSKKQFHQLIFTEKNKINVNAQDLNKRTPLIIACKNENEATVKFLVEQGADVNKNDIFGNTPLIISCRNRNKVIIKYLIEHGADVNKCNNNGEVPL
ncbi:ankyrin, partial [Neocallimastix californiae]